MEKVKVCFTISAEAALRKGFTDVGDYIWTVPDDLPGELKEFVAGWQEDRQGRGYHFTAPFRIGHPDEIVPEIEYRVAQRKAEKEKEEQKIAEWYRIAKASKPEDWLNRKEYETTLRYDLPGMTYCPGSGYNAVPGTYHLHPEVKPTWDKAKGIAEADKKAREEQVAQRQRESMAKIWEEFLADPSMPASVHNSAADAVSIQGVLFNREKCDYFPEVIQKALARNRAIVNEKAAAESRRKRQINDWVEWHGTENQRGRYKLGLLPEKEVRDAIRSEAFAALNDFARYEKLQSGEIEHAEDCDGQYKDKWDIDYDVREATEADHDDYEKMWEIHEALSEIKSTGANVTLKEHVGTCNDCDAETVRRSVKVTIPVGEFTFTREYAV